jgi:hypothetical protein
VALGGRALLRGGETSATYPEPQAGQWVQPVRKGYKFACCDCGLVHKLDFRVKDRRVQFRVFRDNRATGQMRRSMSDCCSHT